MSTALVVLLTGLALFAVVLIVRAADARAWRQGLRAFRVSVPSGLKADEVASWLGHIAAGTHAPRFGLTQPPPIGLEITADANGIQHILLVPETMAGTVLSGLRAALPGVRLDEAPAVLNNRAAPSFAVEGRLRGLHRPLAFERAEQASRGLLAALQPLGPEIVWIQWLFVGAGTPPPVPAPKRDAALAGDLLDDQPTDAEAVRAARRKQQEPLLHGVVRVGITASGRPRIYALFGRVWGTLRGLNAPGAVVVRRLLPSFLIGVRLADIRLPLTRWPVLVNVRELTGLLGMPIGDVALPGLPRAVARQLPPAIGMPTSGTVVAMSTYPGMGTRALALATNDRLRHSWILGPTGVGKSTLLCQLIGQDIAAGRGVVVLDPKGDLVTDVLERVPADRAADVLLIDPSATDHPVGLNVLNLGHGEHARELAVDHLVYLMGSLWRSSWGPRTSDVIRNALLTLSHTAAADGSRFTLVELPELLLNLAFRGFVTSQPGVPEMVQQFWGGYEAMKDGERAQVIGPTLNKLRQFTTRTALRLMLGQSHGVRLDEVFTRRRIVLVNLAKGALGTETTALIGSLVMACLWQATLSRITVPQERRHPVFVYLDEFQDFLRLPIDLADMLAQARGLGVGLVLAHQYLGQLTDDVKTAVLGTARTQVVFQVEYDDAHVLAPRFSPLTHEDLSGLAAYEIAMRPCVHGATLSPVTGRTLPASVPTSDRAALAIASRQRFGRPRAEVEHELRQRISRLGDHAPRIGRQRPGVQS